MRISAIAVCAAFVLMPVTVQAHALKAHLEQHGKTVVVEVFYDDGTLAAGARVIVRDSGQTTIARGRTDRQGRWSFPLPAPGGYRLVANDGLGHLATVEFSVSAGSGVAEGESRFEHQPGALHVGTMRRGEAGFPWLQLAIGLGAIAILTLALIAAVRFNKSRQRT